MALVHLCDNIFSKHPVSYLSGIIVSAVSDHFPVFAIYRNVFLSNQNRNRPAITIRYRLINDNTLSSLNDALADHDFSEVLQITDVSESFSKFEEIIMNYYDNFCLIICKSLSYKKYTKP